MSDDHDAFIQRVEAVRAKLLKLQAHYENLVRLKSEVAALEWQTILQDQQFQMDAGFPN